MMKQSRSRRLAPVAGGVAVALAGAGLYLGLAQSAQPDTRPTSATASVTDGAAYAKEAIENLRAVERFRFTQTVTGVGGATDPGSGTVTAEVDLAATPSDLPKYHSTVHLRGPGGSAVSLDTVAVADELHVRKPKQTAWAKASQKQAKRQGKPWGGGPGRVDVNDPLMFVLEPVDELPPSAFGTPSAVVDGRRTVTVDAGSGATLALAVADDTRLLQEVVYRKGSSQVRFALTDLGSADIVVEAP